MDTSCRETIRESINAARQAPPRWKALFQGLIAAYRSADEERWRLQKALERRLLPSESESFAARVIDALGDALAILDEQGAILKVNDAWRRLADEQVSGRHDCREGDDYLAACDATAGEDPDAKAAADALRAVMSGRLDRYQQDYACHGPPRRRWFALHVTSFTDGGRTRVVVVHREITDQKLAEVALAEKQSVLEQIFRMLPYAIFWKDHEFRYRGCNAHFARDAGLADPADIVGKSDYDLPWPKEQSDLYRERDRIVMETGEPMLNVEAPQLRPDGTTATVLLSKVPVLAGNQIAGVVGAYVDITNREGAEILQRERDGFRDAVAAMERVLGVVAHELRTPLAGLRASTEFVLGYAGDDVTLVRPWIEQVHDQIVWLSETVDSLLEAARINSGRAKWNWSLVALGEVCREATGSLQPLLEENGTQVGLLVEPEDACMNGDADALRRLVVNLVNNARAHASQGRIDVSVRMFNEADVIWSELTVADTGCGIPQDIKEKLGEAFALNSGVIGVGHVQGAGLGLSICKGIAAAHGGELVIESEAGRGTAVRVRMRADLGGPLGGPGAIRFVTSGLKGGGKKTGER